MELAAGTRAARPAGDVQRGHLGGPGSSSLPSASLPRYRVRTHRTRGGGTVVEAKGRLTLKERPHEIPPSRQSRQPSHERHAWQSQLLHLGRLYLVIQAIAIAWTAQLLKSGGRPTAPRLSVAVLLLLPFPSASGAGG
ncbi:uncharacterized protein LOC144102075 [Amblyomma americanum]